MPDIVMTVIERAFSATTSVRDQRSHAGAAIIEQPTEIGLHFNEPAT